MQTLREMIEQAGLNLDEQVTNAVLIVEQEDPDEPGKSRYGIVPMPTTGVAVGTYLLHVGINYLVNQ